MSESEKPLHVRVAAALGMKEIPLQSGPPGVVTYYQYNSTKEYIEGSCPRFDTDWAATGPLIEKYGIFLRRLYIHPELWFASPSYPKSGGADTEDGETPLVAVCKLIILLAKENRLP